MTNDEKLRRRVAKAGGEAVDRRQYVSAIDVLLGMGMLQPAELADWRAGRVWCLEQVIQGNLKKISRVMKFFRQWAASARLKPSETKYMRRARHRRVPLQFSKSGDPQIEKAYSTHYVLPKLSELKRKKLETPPENVVFSIPRESACSECGAELGRGEFLFEEADKVFCLGCAGFGDLEFLPSGDAALTRRSE